MISGLAITCSDAGVPDTAVDRQWYAIDGDPLNGGSIYLANDEIGPGGVMCGGSVGNNVLVMYRSPVTGAEPTAGITFGPANHVTPSAVAMKRSWATTRSARPGPLSPFSGATGVEDRVGHGPMPTLTKWS